MGKWDPSGVPQRGYPQSTSHRHYAEEGSPWCGIHIVPQTEAQQRWNFNQLKENDRLQSAIEDYMLSNGPGITDEEKALGEDINGTDRLTAEAGDRDSALIGIDQDDMENFEDMCNMKKPSTGSSRRVLKMEVSTGSILLTLRVQMGSFRWVGDGR